MLRSQFDSDMLLMEKNEIKKELYRQKPEADLIEVSKDGLRYSTTINSVEGLKLIFFLIPLGDIEDASFGPTEKSQLLIRWLQ